VVGLGRCCGGAANAPTQGARPPACTGVHGQEARTHGRRRGEKWWSWPIGLGPATEAAAAQGTLEVCSYYEVFFSVR